MFPVLIKYTYHNFYTHELAVTTNIEHFQDEESANIAIKRLPKLWAAGNVVDGFDCIKLYTPAQVVPSPLP